MKFFASLYLQNRFFYALTAVIVLFIFGFATSIFTALAKITLLLVLLLLLVDVLLLYAQKGTKLKAQRIMADKLSNGDENEVLIRVQNYYAFSVAISVIDETPFQFQLRNFLFKENLQTKEQKTLRYVLRPVRRGEYNFGALNVYANNNIGFIARRFQFEAGRAVPVYPSYLQMRKYELYAISNHLIELGVKKIRKLGQNREFDQVREYVQGDDIRALNWKATARKNALMVNQYQDEKAQHVYSVLDKGRSMKMPFEEMTLLDYAINASLVISNIAIQKSDKAGIITFSTKVNTHLPAHNQAGQMSKILEVLYNQKTAYKESDYEALFVNLRTKVKQRSLILLYTNFESLASLERQLPYFRNIAKQHLLVVIFFENTEIHQLLDNKPTTTEEIYIKTIAQKFIYEKKLIVKELAKYGIHSILTAPENLTVNTINKYLELKARNMI
jgi:uncharacterized protein (DUF58 family)